MAKKRTTAQRRAAAKAAWAKRRLQSAEKPTPALTVNSPDVVGANFDVLAPGYWALGREIGDAFTQAAFGKGKERHANGRDFDRQPILELSRLYGPGFAAGQAAKKVHEALSNFDKGTFTTEQALAEVHGGIVYLAAVAIRLRELPAKPAKK
jgi:hypothetical protein